MSQKVVYILHLFKSSLATPGYLEAIKGAAPNKAKDKHVKITQDILTSRHFRNYGDAEYIGEVLKRNGIITSYTVIKYYLVERR